MLRRRWLFGVSALVMSLVALPVSSAQTPSPTPGNPHTVSIEATDGWALVGDLYVVDRANPTVLLLHQLYTTRASWNMILPALLDAGYNVLAVDVRGHGDTGGGINWPQAVQDVQTWLDWLRGGVGVRPDAISTMGASMGSSLALLGCANDPACRTAVAISPGWNYYDLNLRDAFVGGLANRPVLLIYAIRDYWPRIGVPRLLEVAAGPVTVETLPQNAHGMDLLYIYDTTLIPRIIEWLNTHGR